MLSCKEVSRLVSESLDRELTFRQWLSMRLHLLMCSLCSRFRRQLLFVHDAAHDYAAREGEHNLADESGLPPDARARIREAMELNGR